ncbi:pectin acetylesterase-family hydrolase [Glycomyces arizonensis]|uniref:pectin acetylesterase-family hydrolase n=1 Tax=Glycomyces arizonensis TaxID=256035 RepID=UPI0003FE9984|nr:pectin acetylesterase-family hydrolase [Glycomyces arizonensis]
MDETPERRPRRLAVALAAALVLIAAGTALAVFGGDETEPPAAVDLEAVRAAAAEYAECVRGQGIADYPDPQVEDDGSVMFTNLSELEAPQEEVEAAQDTCHHILEAVTPSEGGEERHEINPAAAGWEQVRADGDCQCADGSDYGFYAREADPEKVVLYLDGGGACWSAATCAGEGGGYQSGVEDPGGDGLFDFADERNPFADHSFVFVPYCTADLHLGNATTEYEPGLTVHHDGYANGTAALDYLAATFPDAAEVVVIGASSGSAAAPLYGGLAADLLPDAEVTVIADSSGSYPDAPVVNEQATAAWGVLDAVPDWPEYDGMTAEEWSIPGLFIQSGLHDPDIVFARHDYAHDEEQTVRLETAGVPVDDLTALIDANEAMIEDAGVNVLSYVAPGSHHLALDGDRFYAETVDGRALVDWVAEVVETGQAEDVHCTDCD